MLAAGARETAELVVRRALEGRGAWVATLNWEYVARAVRDPGYAHLLKHADLVTGDGMPVVWASRWRNLRPLAERVTGIDLAATLLADARIERVALVGGGFDLDPAAVARLRPAGLAPVRWLRGRVELQRSYVERISAVLRAERAQVVFVGLGVPRQDQLAALLRQRVPGAVVVGVGGAFRILSGRLRRAPRWMQRAGLEWLFRFLQEPHRLWKRYLIEYPLGALTLAAAAARRRARRLPARSPGSAAARAAGSTGPRREPSASSGAPLAGSDPRSPVVP